MRLFMYPVRRDDRQQSLNRAARATGAALLALGMLAAHASARAQVSGSVSLISELSLRGVSLSAGRATPQLSLSYDGVQGWYGGAVAAPLVHLGEQDKATELVVYGGYAHRLASGLSWEAGASNTAFQHASDYNYHEIYAGLASDHLSARLYLAPAYYGYGGRVAYAELNGAYPLRERLKLSAHVGLLHRLQSELAGAREQFDLRLALSYDAGACNLQLAWLGGSRHDERHTPRALALSASYSF